MNQVSAPVCLTGMFALGLGLLADAKDGAPSPPPRLGIAGSQFTVSGKPTFLLGMNYYGALGATKDVVRQDLADLKRHGINWIRVWATWAAFDHDVSAVDNAGQPRQPNWTSSAG